MIFTHLNLCLATATYNFKWVKITHIHFKIWDQIFGNLDFILNIKKIETYLKRLLSWLAGTGLLYCILTWLCLFNSQHCWLHRIWHSTRLWVLCLTYPPWDSRVSLRPQPPQSPTSCSSWPCRDYSSNSNHFKRSKHSSCSSNNSSNSSSHSLQRWRAKKEPHQPTNLKEHLVRLQCWTIWHDIQPT